VACGKWIGQVARCSGLRTEGHNTGKEGNERNGGIWYIGKVVCLLGSWAIDRKRSDVVEVRVLCWEVTVEWVNGWQRKGMRCSCGDVRRTFGVVAEGCRVLPGPGFVSGVDVVVVGSV